MQRLRVDQIAHCRWYGTVRVLELQRLGRIFGLPREERYWATLKCKPSGTKGGTVVPPCDFQRRLAKTPVFKGVPP